MSRGDDEHMSVPTWRMRQLQNVEQAARVVVELSRGALRESTRDAEHWALFIEICDVLGEALGDD